jgi:hypothetical protein
MKEATQRSIFRWIHIVLSIPILGYIYSPFDKLPDYAPKTRFVFVPVMVLSGLWMWKGHVVRRLISKRPMGGAGLAASRDLTLCTAGHCLGFPVRCFPPVYALPAAAHAEVAGPAV